MQNIINASDKSISSGVIAVDDGGNSTCITSKDVNEFFPSIKGVYGKRTLTEVYGKHDYIVEYDGKVYAMGTLAQYDCKYPIQMHSNSKQNLFFDLSVLVAIHQYGYTNNYVVIDVPIAMHNEKEKFGRIGRLIGEKKITVNGIEKRFNIMDVKVAPETASAFWIEQPEGKSRYLDLGSRTIGYATALKSGENVRFIDTESGTIEGKGLEALGDDYEPNALADLICGKLLSIWNARDKVNLIGGGALDKKLVECIMEYFPNAFVVDNPKMANAKGMYLLGRIAYGLS